MYMIIDLFCKESQQQTYESYTATTWNNVTDIDFYK